jgi:threonine/homoserine/homoserine lactone efflux protein
MDLLIALALFCLVTLFTPGPNNLMLMTSGLNFGVRRGVPHLLGVVLGFSLMGAALQRVLKDPRAVRVFNVIMALLLVASLYPIFADGLPGVAR